jgi:hypothetical protein
VVVLATGGMAMDWLHVEKVPFPLIKSLALLDENNLSPYKVLSKERIGNEEIVKELGTQEYIQWGLEDTDAAADSPVRKCSLFITYYEQPDHVPHVPEECYIGSGYQVLAADSVTFKVDRVSGSSEPEELDGKYVVFASTSSKQWWADTKFSVLYIFNVNRAYAGSRDEARWALNKYVFRKQVYFSKIEWKFFNDNFIYPGKAEAVAASEKLLKVLLPVLEREHWPDWPAARSE